jgi:thioredoxin reductase
MTYDCVIVGAGPAGLIAAIQLKRSGHSVLLIEKSRIGGLLRNAKKVENYLGFAGGISGKELSRRLEEQLQSCDVEVVFEEVKEIRKGKDAFAVLASNPSSHEARSVIVATGTLPRKAGIEGEDELAGERVFYEPADLPRFNNKKKFLIIGGGDAGFDYAVNLSSQGHSATIMTKSRTSCLLLLKEEAEARGIEVHEHITTKRMKKKGEMVEVAYDEETFTADYVLIAVGREPCLPRGVIEQEGLYIVGDVKNASRRQVHIAAGDGLRAALHLSDSIRGHRS